MSDELYLLLPEDVKVTLPDGSSHSLRYPLKTLRRISRALDRPVFGAGNVLQNVTEDVLPELIYQGICDPKTGEPPLGKNGEPITLDTILEMPSSSVGYLIQKFSQAYTQKTQQQIEDDAKAAKNVRSQPVSKPN